jgi:hypothetical protein
MAIQLAWLKFKLTWKDGNDVEKAEGGGMIFRNQRKCLKMEENRHNFRHNFFLSFLFC